MGDHAYNAKLSRARANAVETELVAAGVKGVFATAYYGKRKPVVPTPDGVAEPRNRRVTVSVQ